MSNGLKLVPKCAFDFFTSSSRAEYLLRKYSDTVSGTFVGSRNVLSLENGEVGVLIADTNAAVVVTGGDPCDVVVGVVVGVVDVETAVVATNSEGISTASSATRRLW